MKDFKTKEKALLLKREALLRTLRDTEALTEPSYDARLADESDQALEVTAVVAGARISNGIRLELEKIQKALDRIRENNYGVCCECEARIPARRLLVLPETELCLDCQEEQERASRMDEWKRSVVLTNSNTY